MPTPQSYRYLELLSLGLLISYMHLNTNEVRNAKDTLMIWYSDRIAASSGAPWSHRSPSVCHCQRSTCGSSACSPPGRGHSMWVIWVSMISCISICRYRLPQRISQWFRSPRVCAMSVYSQCPADGCDPPQRRVQSAASCAAPASARADSNDRYAQDVHSSWRETRPVEHTD